MLVPSSFSERAYLLPKEEVSRALRVRLEQGLSSAEAKKRHTIFGYNEIASYHGHDWLRVILNRFKDPIILILMVAALISLFLGNYGDMAIIMAVIVIDAALNFLQLWRTEKTLERVRQSVGQVARVLRDGKVRSIPARELVVGDVIELQAGDHVPADARVIVSHGLSTREGALTGESEDVTKQSPKLVSRTPLANQLNMVFMGTSVVNGSGRAVITATGGKTEYGKIGQLLKTGNHFSSPLKQKLKEASWQASVFISVILAALVLAYILMGKSLVETVQLALTLFVSAIPENLTMVLTIALAVSVSRLAKHGGLIRQLASVETMGAVTVICADKTGTLTKGEMSAVHLDCLQGTIIDPYHPPRDYLSHLALIGFALASDAHRVAAQSKEYIGSTTERSALAFTESFGLEQKKLRDQWRVRDEIAFNPQWKYRATLHDHPHQNSRMIFVSGAPDVLLERSSYMLDRYNVPTLLTDKKRFRVTQKITSRSIQGQRTIGIAVRRSYERADITHRDIHQLLFLGVLVIRDPIRPEVSTAVQEAHHAGVAVKLITGDHEATAQAVARAIGLTVTIDTICTGAELESLSDEELRSIVQHTVVFSRVTPLGKQRIIRALQARKEVVAMTGDGVNDAVALKTADVGVAMGSGRDIAKDAAKLVLTNDNFATIIAAIREGRKVRDNIRKVIGFLLSTNFAEVAIFVGSIFLGLPIPLSPGQILWINLVTDTTTDVALAFEPEEGNSMRRQPEKPAAALFSPQSWWHIGFSGLVMTVSALGLYWYTLRTLALDEQYARTMMFAFVALSSLLSVWSWRSLHHSMYAFGLKHNPWLTLATAASFLLQLLAIYLPPLQRFFNTAPLSAEDWMIILTLAFISICIIDVRKLVFARRVLWSQRVKLVPVASN